jgi:membrane protein DedA with SNARE-associated domain
VSDRSRRRLVLGGLLALLAAALAATVASAGLADLTEVASSAAVDLLESYGLAALLGVFVLEGAIVLFFVPSETLVPAAVVAFGDDLPTLVTVLAVAVVGATVGQAALFVLARRVGRDFVLERGWLGVREAHLDRFDAWFDRIDPRDR